LTVGNIEVDTATQHRIAPVSSYWPSEKNE
jgi:hypothetical protein